MQTLKIAAGIGFLGIWSWALLNVYFNPEKTPEFLAYVPVRKAFLLGRDLQPTFFTLFMGLLFGAVTLLGLLGLLTGKRSNR
jgi:hypothetical protein